MLKPIAAAPVVVRAPRWKSAGMLVVALLFTMGGGFGLHLIWQWPPSSAATWLVMAICASGLAASTLFLLRLFSPARLVLTPAALILQDRDRERRWAWTDISQIKVAAAPFNGKQVIVHERVSSTGLETGATVLPWGLPPDPLALARILRAAQTAALSGADFTASVAASYDRRKLQISFDAVRILLILGCMAFVAYAFSSTPKPDEIQTRCGHAYRFSATKKQLRAAQYGGCPTREDVKGLGWSGVPRSAEGRR